MSVSNAEHLSPAQRVTAAIAQALERGARPWIKPWREEACGPPLILPRRANGEAYRGMNVVALWAAAELAGYSSPFWFTFKQALALGGQVRKGERGSFVVFYKEFKKDEAPDATAADENAKARRILRGYVVFNLAQIDGLDLAAYGAPLSTPLASDELGARFAKVPATIRFGGPHAFYAPSTDHVQLPPRSAFSDDTQFYATLAHEYGHWTRHSTRLNRDFGQKRFGDHGYALE